METLVLVLPPVPAEFGITLGEYFHNLRGSLDHLVSGIVANVTKAVNRRVDFPFHGTKEQLYRSRDSHPLFKAAPDVWNLIVEEFRPYRASGPDGPTNPQGADGLLWAIKELHNQDKHRLIIPSFISATASMDLVPGWHYNAYQALGAGEFVVGRGRNLVPQEVYSSELVLSEPDITGTVKLIPFIQACTDLVARVGQALETRVFGEQAPTIP